MTELELRDAYLQTFSTPSGEVVFKDMGKFCRAMRTSHVPGESHETAFNEGKRAVYIRAATMMHEAKDKETRKRLRNLENKEEQGNG